jgi:hypothetical protein
MGIRPANIACLHIVIKAVTHGLGQSLARTYPPPLYPHTPHGQNWWFSGIEAEKEDGLYLET